MIDAQHGGGLARPGVAGLSRPSRAKRGCLREAKGRARVRGGSPARHEGAHTTRCRPDADTIGAPFGAPHGVCPLVCVWSVVLLVCIKTWAVLLIVVVSVAVDFRHAESIA